MISHRNKQSGHAAILFAMMIPLLFGVFILGTDGARALQAKARLEEASEAAVLAVAGQSGSTQAAHDEMATNYIQYYFPFAEMEDITTEDIPCADNSACDTEDDAVNRFYEYTVSATIAEPNWFSKDTISTSFGDSTDVGGYSSARKYQSQTVDIILVSDFSSSMLQSTGSSVNSKVTDLKSIISDVADTINEYNEHTGTQKNTMAFVGFGYYTYGAYSTSISKNGSTYSGFPYYTYLMCTGAKNSSHPANDGWCGASSSDLGNIDYSESVSAANIFDESAYLPTSIIQYPYTISASTYNNIDYSYQKMYTKNSDSNTYHFRYYNLGLTSDVSELSDTIDNFVPQGSTAFYTGLIRGAQIANKGTNSRRLIIILSDGNNTHEDVTTELVADGLCDNITDTLNSQTTTVTDSEGDEVEESVKSRIFAIGFGYQASQNPGMTNCVGTNNVYDSNDSDEIKDKILELIAEEMGRLTPSDETN
ncbi:pilus assembly protein [Vibrio tritonius]|uniref:TadE/TadG family type IV pilus assembly protein n=1 Tax=Vibrio tritonius TaxID=1435069 RepID=UPI00315D3DE0